MAGHKVRLPHQVRGADNFIPETKVGCCNPPRFLGIIGEISLTILIRAFTNDHDAVLVGTHGTVSTYPVELRLVSPLWHCTDFWNQGKGKIGNIVYDTYREPFFGLFGGQVVVYGDHHGWCSIFRAEAVPSADDHRGIGISIEQVTNIQVEGFSVGTRFLGPVENSDLLH